MHQAGDVKYLELLRCIRKGELTEDDYTCLTVRIVGQLDFESGCGKIITRSNAVRHQLNFTGVLGMAARTKNPVYLFLAEHGRHPKVKNSELLALGDNSSKTPGPGIFAYTEGMPIMINSNRYTVLSIVNGKEGVAAGVSFDPTSDVIHIRENIYLITKPPTCVYMRIKDAKFKQLDGLDENVIPIPKQGMKVSVIGGKFGTCRGEKDTGA